MRAYINLGRKQGVHEAPSVAARGSSWWTIQPDVWDIAVPMNGQFRHEVAWLNPQGAVTNNFNALRFSKKEHALVVGASLSSAFGALARLYVSGEVGCEGARRVLLAQFLQWPVVDPDAAPRRLVRKCLERYERWRRFEVSELDWMGEDELNAWRALTLSVAEAALGDGRAGEAKVLADAAIEATQKTVARRREREGIALRGRTRRGVGGRGTSLVTRVRQWAVTSEDYRKTVDLLTAGSRVFRIRAPAEVHALSLFEEEFPLASTPEYEVVLGQVSVC